MKTVFPDLPFNTDRIFTRGITHEGCVIWIPVSKNNDVKKEQKILQKFLDEQPMPTKTVS